MKLRKIHFVLWVCMLLFTNSILAQEQAEINFCGEVVPMERDFVQKKLMSVIAVNKKNINFENLKKKSDYYFPYISSQLAKYGIPDDFKYLPIIESGFSNATSKVGAHGFWQIMPGTANDLGLKVKSSIDERNNVIKSTKAACMHIQSLYKQLGSWTLVACAYNFGLGNVRKTIKAQKKTDYYQMRLNSETALYLYRLVAIKELFINPKLNGSYALYTKERENIIEEKDNSFNQVTFKIKTLDNKFLTYVDRVEPKMAMIFLRLETKGNLTYAISLNDCDMFGFIIKKGSQMNLNINQGGDKISASIENLPDLVLVDLSGNTAIEERFFKAGLVVRVQEKS